MPLSRLAPAACIAALVALLTASVAAQAPNPVELGKRTARSKYTLGRLFALQELPDGRVIASDQKEQVFRLVDFAKGDVGLVGRQGDTPDSYRAAAGIFRLAGDSLALFDPAGRKMLHVTPQGSVAEIVPLPSMSNNRRLGTLIGVDQNGALYFTVPERFDTATKGLTGISSITRLGIGADADEPQLTFRTRRADQLKVNGMSPFTFRDAVAVRSDGLMARVVADTYEVVWGRNASEVGRTGPLPYTPIALAPAEQQFIKDSIVAMMKAGMAGGGATRTFSNGGAAGGTSGSVSMSGGQTIMISTIGGGGGGAPVMMSGGGDVAFSRMASTDSAARVAGGNGTRTITNAPFNPADIPMVFPDVKPPMPSPSSGVTAIFDLNGNLWVARERVHGDAVPHYDVIAEGKGLIARINLPVGTRLVGFGKNAVYLARSDDTSTGPSDWLERYAMPKM